MLFQLGMENLFDMGAEQRAGGKADSQQPGQAVTRGQLLATMVSREALVLAGDLARARARQAMTGAEAARMTTLAREGVVAGARADTAVAADREAAINAREAQRLLARAGADNDGMVRLLAPIGGRAARMTVEAGAPVDGMTAPFVIDADGSRWQPLAAAGWRCNFPNGSPRWRGRGWRW